jgi:hypothetical protein
MTKTSIHSRKLHGRWGMVKMILLWSPFSLFLKVPDYQKVLGTVPSCSWSSYTGRKPNLGLHMLFVICNDWSYYSYQYLLLVISECQINKMPNPYNFMCIKFNGREFGIFRGFMGFMHILLNLYNLFNSVLFWAKRVLWRMWKERRVHGDNGFQCWCKRTNLQGCLRKFVLQHLWPDSSKPCYESPKGMLCCFLLCLACRGYLSSSRGLIVKFKSRMKISLLLEHIPD